MSTLQERLGLFLFEVENMVCIESDLSKHLQFEAGKILAWLKKQKDEVLKELGLQHIPPRSYCKDCVFSALYESENKEEYYCKKWDCIIPSDTFGCFNYQGGI